MFKRALCLIFVALTLVSMLCGCSGKPDSTEPTPSNILANAMQKSDPSQDEDLNILMIGNSFCYYYVEELYGLLTAAGYKNVNVCNVYYSGCTLEQHWTWWKNNESNYEFYTTNSTGRNCVKGTNLKYCLEQRNWDVISLQESSTKSRQSGAGYLTLAETYLTDLWGYIKEQFPLSRHLWQQIWCYEIGHNRNGIVIETFDQQVTDTNNIRAFSLAVCEKYDLENVPSGEAWQIVRQDGYDKLCARLAVNNGEGDYYHDGDIGGGQYLNACVWFETITGESCIGNTYRPKEYQLDDKLIETFQSAAHQATENAK